jgi:hypothetical protein
MKHFLLSAACLIALATSVLAQDAPSPPPPGQVAAPGPGAPPPLGPKGQLRAPSPPAPSADASPPPPLADRMQALRLHLRRGPAIRLTMRAARRLLHLRQGADRLRRHRRRRRISASLAGTM